MPTYHFLLTDTETGERRSVSVAADSKDEAEDVIYRQEAKKVNYQPDEDIIKEFEANLKAGTISPRDKAHLFAARQEKPYAIKKAKA
jgi:hypothetical protein